MSNTRPHKQKTEQNATRRTQMHAQRTRNARNTGHRYAVHRTEQPQPGTDAGTCTRTCRAQRSARTG